MKQSEYRRRQAIEGIARHIQEMIGIKRCAELPRVDDADSLEAWLNHHAPTVASYGRGIDHHLQQKRKPDEIAAFWKDVSDILHQPSN
jgi:hypothetical protein